MSIPRAWRHVRSSCLRRKQGRMHTCGSSLCMHVCGVPLCAHAHVGFPSVRACTCGSPLCAGALCPGASSSSAPCQAAPPSSPRSHTQDTPLSNSHKSRCKSPKHPYAAMTTSILTLPIREVTYRELLLWSQATLELLEQQFSMCSHVFWASFWRLLCRLMTLGGCRLSWTEHIGWWREWQSRLHRRSG